MGGGNTVMKIEIGVVWPHIKEHRQPPKAGRSKEDVGSAETLSSHFWLPEL
jgi:hypothetical protein